MATAILRYMSDIGAPPAEKEVTLVSGKYTFTSDDLPVMVCDEYSFAGWYFDGEYIEPGDELHADEGEVIELKAGWGAAVMPTIPSAVGTVYIYYSSEYGETPEYRAIPTELHVLTEDELPMLSADGYIFVGWMNDGKIVAAGDTVDTGGGAHVYLVAKWEVDTSIKYLSKPGITHYHERVKGYVDDAIDAQAVRYDDAQELTDEQKTQARENIGAISNAELTAEAAVLTTEIEKKVEKVDGMGLSSNDYTDAEQAKLGTVEEGATATSIVIKTWTSADMICTMTITNCGTYNFEYGMTFGEWIESSYNVDDFHVSGNYIWSADDRFVLSMGVTVDTVITDGKAYHTDEPA